MEGADVLQAKVSIFDVYIDLTTTPLVDVIGQWQAVEDEKMCHLSWRLLHLMNRASENCFKPKSLGSEFTRTS